MVDLAVALGLWAIGLWVARMERRFPALFFLTGAATLGAGLLSTTGSDWGSRLFYLLLAWCSPALFALHYELISRPPARSARLTLWAFVALAGLCSLPPLFWTRAALEQKGWNLYWREGVRLMLFLSVVASVVLVAWYAWHNWPEAKRRPIRLIAFGNVAAAMPLMLLSLLPSTFSFPAKIPWEVSFLGLLLSPLFYSYALMPAHQLRPGLTLKHTSVYYLLFMSFCFLFLLGAFALGRLSKEPQRGWPWAGILSNAVCVLAAVPLSRLFERLTDWIWFGKGASYTGLLQRLAESLSTAQNRTTLQRLLLHDLASAMHLTSSVLFLMSGDQTSDLVKADGSGQVEGESNVLPGSGLLAAYLMTQGKPVPHQQVRGALSDATLSDEEQAVLSLTGVAMWLPLMSGGVLSGVLLIGPKQGDDFFTAEDERILTDLARQAGIAAHNLRWAAEVHRRLEEGREAERQHLAREIHDGPVQDLEAMRLRVGILSGKLSGQVNQAFLSIVQDDLLRTIDGLRTICRNLRPPALAPFGLAAALRSDIEQLGETHPELEVQAELAHDGQTLPMEVRLALYRIYHEAVSNIVRHAQAKQVRIRLCLDEDQVLLEVCDDGLGFQVPGQWITLGRQGHLGLLGAAERAESIGGHLKVDSAPQKGTVIRAVVPRLTWQAAK